MIFPESGQTKGQLADYYAAIAPIMLPFAARRPISLVRCPQGRGKKCFFQKHDSGSFGDHVHQVPITEKDGGAEDYLYVEDVADYVRALEETRDTAELPEASGEAIAREFERYLRRRNVEPPK